MRLDLRFKRELREYLEGRCYICNTKRNLTIHHKIPKKVGGLDLIENVVYLCKRCHNNFHSIFEGTGLVHCYLKGS